MRFLMLNWRDPFNPLSGGAERVTQAYLGELARRGHDVHWFANDFAGSIPGQSIEGIQIHRGGGKGSSIFSARKWHRDQPRFDLVIDQHHGIPWFAPWWCRTHCVAYIHEVLGPIWNAFYPWPLSAIGRAQEAATHWLYRKVPFWTACESTRDHLKKHGVKSVEIIRYGVHTQPLDPLPPKPLAAPYYFMVVSRLAPNKRIDHAVLFLKECLSAGLPARLDIIGTGECHQSLVALVHKLGITEHVQFLGGLPEQEKDARLSKAHFLLHTSQREGWGLNVIEANALGTPALVYPVAGLIESTIHEQTGLVTNFESPKALLQTFQSILNNDRGYQEFRRHAQNRAREFHWSRVLPRAADWLEGAARGEVIGSPERSPRG